MIKFISFLFFFIFSIVFFSNQILIHHLKSYNNSNYIFLYNKSIISILIASQTAFIFSFLFYFYQNKKLFLFYVTSIFIFIVLMLTISYKGRASWIGFLVSIFYILNSRFSLSNKNIFWAKPILFLSLTVSLFFYKADSSNGRLLIYKVSSKLFLDNPIFGVGFGQFKANYNNYQAAYFTDHNIDTKEALLADNTFYAFNDYYQFLIENGIVGFAILLIFVFFFYKKIWKATFKETQIPIVTAAKASIICILVAALFSYPVQILPIQFQFIFCVVLLIFLSISANESLTKNQRLCFKVFTSIIFISFCSYAALQINYKIKSQNAFELIRSGFRNKAIEEFKELNTSSFNDGNDMYLYAKELHNINKVKEAKLVLEIAKTKLAFNEMYKLSAAIEMELNNYNNAEQDLLKVIYMIPNRMQPRLNMMEFYLQQKDTAHANYWANSIMNMPVKIPSETTRAIQQKVKVFLKK